MQEGCGAHGARQEGATRGKQSPPFRENRRRSGLSFPGEQIYVHDNVTNTTQFRTSLSKFFAVLHGRGDQGQRSRVIPEDSRSQLLPQVQRPWPLPSCWMNEHWA